MTSMFTGVSGLTVSQSALNNTAHNLANVDTKGYVRQQSLITDYSYTTIGESYNSSMQVGLGANMAAIRQVRDAFLDKSYRLEIGRQGFYEEQYKAVEEVEGLFGELEGEPFQDIISEFWTSLQELAKEPDSIAKRATLIQTAVSFIERSENISNQLKNYQDNLNTQITDKVRRINAIGDEIRALNLKIRQEESNGQKANDYRDSRNFLLDELGELVKYTYKENAAGIINVNVEGVQFVTEDTVHYMEAIPVSETTRMLKPVWAGNDGTDVFRLDTAYSTSNNTDVGSLKGILVARGDYAAQHIDIPIRGDYSTEVAYNNAVKDYNNLVQPSVIMTVQAQFDQLVHGVVTVINDILSPNVSLEDYATNMDVIATSLNIGGTDYTIPADTGKLLLWDEANAPVGMDRNSTGREALFNRKSTERYQEATMTLADGTTKTVYVYNQEDKEDNYSLFTIGEIEINKNIKIDYSYIPLSANQTSGQSGAFDIATCEKLISAWQEKFATLGPNTLTENDFTDYYTAMIGDIANRGEVFNTISTNQRTMVENIDNQRQMISGVSSDEELTNLIKYQHAYNAAARYVNVIDQMLEHIITRL